MQFSPVRVLLIEDDEDDYVLTRDRLNEMTDQRYELEWVDSYDAARAALLQGRHDVCLLDYYLGEHCGLDLLKSMIGVIQAPPIILLTGIGDRHIDIAAMEAGAADYLIKSRLDTSLLERSIRYAIERRRLRAGLTQALEAREESARQYRALFDSARDAIVIADDDGRYVDANPAACELFGVSREALIGASMINFAPPEAHDAVAAQWRVFLEQSYQEGTFILQRTDEEHRHLEYRAQAHFMPGLHLSILRDCTERKQAEDERDRFFTLSRDLLCVATLDGRFKRLNPAWQETLGYEAEELLLRDSSDFVLPEDREATLEARTRLNEGREVFALENRYRCKDGSYRWLQWNSRSVPSEGRVYAVARDVTYQMEIQNELTAALDAAERSQSELIDILESVQDAFYALDRDWNFTYVNEAGERLHNRWRDDLLGRNLWDEFPEAVGTQFQHEYERAMRTRQIVTFEEYYAPLGSWLDTRVFPSGTGLSIYVRDVTEQRKAQDALKQSEERFRSLTEDGSELLSILDAQGTIVYESPSITRILGYDPEALVGRNSFAFVHPDDLPAVMTALTEGIGVPRKITALEYRFRHNDGSWRWMESVGNNLLEEPSIRGIVVNSRDITERKRVENAMRESERFARSTVDALSAHIAILDEGGAIIAVNRAWRVFCARNDGEDLKAYEGLNYLQVCETATGANATEALAFSKGIRQVLSGRTFEFTLEYPCHSPNEQRWFIGKVTRFPGDGPVRIVVAHEDITERKRMEDTIRELAAIVESSQDAIVGNDPDGVITSWNQGAERIYGYRAVEMIGRSISLLIPPDQADEYPRLIEQIRSGEFVDHYDTTHRRKDGSLIQVSITLSPTRNAEGDLIGASTIARDITERKRLQMQLLQTEKLAAMGELVAGVAHEINNPLAAILFNAESLEMHNDPEVREDAAAIHRMTDRASRIVRHLLTFARDDHEERSPCSVDALIESALEICQYRLRKNEVTLDLHVASSLPPVYANSNQIQQVLLNLINNAEYALRAREDERTISITTGTHVLEESEWVRITVQDNGCGMPEHVRKRIFDPFFTTKGVGEGTGLGLPICHGIVTAHGGRITVESNPGEGTIFTLLLPAESVSKQI